MIISSEKVKYEVKPYESRVLILTSTLTTIPIYLAFHRGLYFHAITSIGTAACSIMYWVHPIHGWRRNLDLFYAKYSFLVYLISGGFFLPRGLCTFIFYLGTIFLTNSYLATMKYPDKWIYYHVLFHLLSIATKTHIIINL